MKIFLIRHGESKANAQGVHAGQRVDSPLSKKGKEQAGKVRDKLRNEKIDAIYSSDLLRALQTAKIIAKAHKLEVKTDKRLREYDMGDFSDVGDKWEKFQKYKEEESKKRKIKTIEVAPPNGESENAHYLRVEDFLKKVINKIDKSKNIIIVAHGGTNKVFFGATGLMTRKKMYEIKQENCCINELEFNGKKWKTRLVNFVEHLK